MSEQHFADISTELAKQDAHYKTAVKMYKKVVHCKPYAASVLYNWAKCLKSRAMLELPGNMDLLQCSNQFVQH